MLKLVKIYFLLLLATFAFSKTTLKQGNVFAVQVSAASSCSVYANSVIYLDSLKNTTNGITLDFTTNNSDNKSNHLGFIKIILQFLSLKY